MSSGLARPTPPSSLSGALFWRPGLAPSSRRDGGVGGAVGGGGGLGF